MIEELENIRNQMADEFVSLMTKDQKFVYKPKIAVYISFTEGFNKAVKLLTEEKEDENRSE